MPQIDLVTGFLGSGKTTFIKKYAKFLIANGLMVGILENDYGAINIDMLLLEELMGNNCDVEMIVGGDGILSHRRRFHTKLISMAMMGYDRVIVEPSGIYDTDEFFDTLAEEPLCRWYSPGSVIAIVDAGMDEELSEESEYLLVSQTDCAGTIILNRCGEGGGGEAGTEEIAADNGSADAPGTPAEREQRAARVLAHLNRAAERFRSDRHFTSDDILAKDWEALTAEDYARIARSGMVPSNHIKLPVERESGYGTLFYYGMAMNMEMLRKKTAETFADPACGDVMRIKGFVRTGDGTRVQVNATERDIRIEPTVFAQEVLIITGENLRRERIDQIWAEHAQVITPGDTVM